MDTSTIWWILCGLLVAVELTVGTLYLLLIATGLAIAAILGYFEASLTIQITAAALISSISCGLLYQLRKNKMPSLVAVNNSNNLDIGQIVQVEQWQFNDKTVVQYRGAQWQAQLANPSHTSNTAPAPGAYIIIDIQGSYLILQACS